MDNAPVMAGIWQDLEISEGKSLVACLLRERTCVSNAWIASRLCMGHPGSVSRMVSACRKNKKRIEKCNGLAEILSSDT
jgi:hypothetical protein